MLAQKNIHAFHAAQRFEGKKVQTVPGSDLLAESSCHRESRFVHSRRHGSVVLYRADVGYSCTNSRLQRNSSCTLPIKRERFILPSSMRQSWRESIRYSRQAECRLSVRWHTERRVCRRFYKSIRSRQSICDGCQAAGFPCVMWPSTCLPVLPRWKCWQTKRPTPSLLPPTCFRRQNMG